jgi:zinc transporter
LWIRPLAKPVSTFRISAAIFLPPDFLTGLPGINVSGIPGEDHSWSFGIFLVSLTILVVGQLFYFGTKKWL